MVVNLGLTLSLILGERICCPLLVLGVQLMYLHFVKVPTVVLSNWPLEDSTEEDLLNLTESKYLLTTLWENLFT